jgi:putative addiction module killer protein
MAMQIFHYVTPDGRDLFQDWLDRLRDRKARTAVQRRVDRLKGGGFGDCSFCRGGVWELRVDIGAGYRVYYARSGGELILILCAGSKSTQDADISRAVYCWQDYLRRSK